jgi:hypothetical protein
VQQKVVDADHTCSSHNQVQLFAVLMCVLNRIVTNCCTHNASSIVELDVHLVQRMYVRVSERVNEVLCVHC